MSAEKKKDDAIAAVRILFKDTSVSPATTKRLLEEVAEEISDLLATIVVPREGDE